MTKNTDTTVNYEKILRDKLKRYVISTEGHLCEDTLDWLVALMGTGDLRPIVTDMELFRRIVGDYEHYSRDVYSEYGDKKGYGLFGVNGISYSCMFYIMRDDSLGYYGCYDTLEQVLTRPQLKEMGRRRYLMEANKNG